MVRIRYYYVHYPRNSLTARVPTEFNITTHEDDIRSSRRIPDSLWFFFSIVFRHRYDVSGLASASHVCSWSSCHAIYFQHIKDIPALAGKLISILSLILSRVILSICRSQWFRFYILPFLSSPSPSRLLLQSAPSQTSIFATLLSRPMVSTDRK